MNFKEVAERTGLEPATPCVTGRYSNQLNYRSELELRYKLAEWTGLEPATPCVTGRYSNQLNYHSAQVRCIIMLKDSNVNSFLFFFVCLSNQ